MTQATFDLIYKAAVRAVCDRVGCLRSDQYDWAFEELKKELDLFLLPLVEVEP